jgi:D-glycero-beta-D-manno-heptose 1-phosphate adenylyltransferase
MTPEPAPAGALPEPAGLRSRPALAAEAAELRVRGLRLVFTNGCFDLLHPGHVLYLAQARALGDLLVVGLNSDESVARLKGPGRPYLDARARATLLLALRAVDRVAVFAEDTPRELIVELRPHVLVKGGDYRPENVVGREEVAGWGGKTMILPFHPGFSSRALARRIRAAPGE